MNMYKQPKLSNNEKRVKKFKFFVLFNISQMKSTILYNKTI